MDPVETNDPSRIYAPGICDNAAGLTALLAIAAALRFANITPPIPILFAANVGEEGEGDLRGMRHLFERGPYRTRIASALILEGGGTAAAINRALGSLRFRITITGPGGHSWADAGTPNPILLLSKALTEIAALELPTDPLTTLNVGHISGGTSINSIPESASALLDLRSTDPTQLISTATRVHEIFDDIVTAQSTTAKPLKLHIETIGNRPAATLPDDSPSSTPSAPSTATSPSAPNSASAPPTPTSPSRAESPPWPWAVAAWAVASTPSRSGTTPPTARPPSAASSSPSSTPSKPPPIPIQIFEQLFEDRRVFTRRHRKNFAPRLRKH
ncbi:M20/M25/M40 family metallo-hydrolase [Tunturiibacter gelidiferens]